MDAPLTGLKVLELARILAGPWACQLLADLGADVIKVERRVGGDDTRGWGPPFVPGAAGDHLDAAYFHATNRGKRSFAADFDDPVDLAKVGALAANADVVVENFKVGGLVKYGLDARTLRAAHPMLVYCSITGFGQDGPYASRAGYDFLIQGMAGPMSITGQQDGPPSKAGYATADLFTGLYATTAILAALRRRDIVAEGAFIDCALMDSQVAVLGNQAMNYLVSGLAPGRLGNGHPNIVPYDVYPAADGHLIIAVGNDGQFGKLANLLDAPDWIQDPRFATNAARVRHRDILTPLVAARTLPFRKDDLLARLEASGVPAGPINTIPEVFADPQVKARGMRIDLPAPEAAGGAIPSVRTPILIDGVAQVALRPSPGLGAHTAEILADPAWGGSKQEPS